MIYCLWNGIVRRGNAKRPAAKRPAAKRPAANRRPPQNDRRRDWRGPTLLSCGAGVVFVPVPTSAGPDGGRATGGAAG